MAIFCLSCSQTQYWHETARLKLNWKAMMLIFTIVSINWRYTLWSMAPIELWDRSIMAVTGRSYQVLSHVNISLAWAITRFSLAWILWTLLMSSSNFALNSCLLILAFYTVHARIAVPWVQEFFWQFIPKFVISSSLSQVLKEVLSILWHKFQAFHSCSSTSHVYNVQIYEIMICAINNQSLIIVTDKSYLQ